MARPSSTDVPLIRPLPWLLVRLQRRPVVAVAGLSLALQLASTTWWLKPYVMPNAALDIAQQLHTTGRYEGGSWARLKGRLVPGDPPLRSFQLPGEPLYLAAGLATLEGRLFAYWHVAVAVLLAMSTAAAARAVFGPAVALGAGLVASLDPVLVVHGPVYDDAFLGAALLWSVVAMLLGRWTAGHPREAGQGGRSGPWRVHGLRPARSDLVLAIAAGWAAVTRTEAQVALAAAALCCIVAPVARPLRRAGVVVAVGVTTAIGAWALRNFVIQHHVVVGSTHDGITLWESNGPYAGLAIARGQVDAFMVDSGVMGPLWRETGPLDEVEADAVFRRAALAEIATHPARAVLVGLRKAAISISGVRPERPLSAARNVGAIAGTSVLALLALVGLRRTAWPQDARFRIVAAGAALLGLEILAFLFVGPAGQRYWIAWRPVLWVIAGCAIAGPWRASG